jgi:hypothetical protein
MNGNLRTFLFLAITLLLPSAAAAQFPDSLILEFDFEGFGNLILDSPPVYSNDIVAGDPQVIGGTWWWRLDDSEWPPAPPAGDATARWNYIFNNYFVYTPGAGANWTAYFDGNSLPTKPVWELSHPVNGTMGGTLVWSVTILDWNGNGVLELDERTFGTFSGTIMVMKYGTGNFSKYCGSGAFNGAYFNNDPANYADDFVEGHCILDLINCQVGTEETTWSALKQIYR